jgi:rhodanese-related sulfurtransferase
MMEWKRVLPEGIWLAVLSVALAGVYNTMAPKERSLAWIGSYASGDSARPAPSGPAAQPATKTASQSAAAIAPPKDPGLLYLEISGDVIERLHSAKALFIDARRTEVYRQGHIAGARSIAIWERDVDVKIGELQKEGIPPEQVIVVYCSGGDCKDSINLAEKLALAGYYNLYADKDGFPDWVRRGLPVTTGDKP